MINLSFWTTLGGIKSWKFDEGVSCTFSNRLCMALSWTSGCG